MSSICTDQQLEIWGGVEGTINRVGDIYHDQLVMSGHARRETDIETFAALGVQAIRYPISWERVAPGALAAADWSWADRRLGELRRCRLRPIVGLVHHGSGPRGTNLLCPAFAPGLADYARAVAQRYPWIQDYTPVNEPLTTARFSALYGHWYPHHHSGRSFARAVIEQCKATVLAMQAIRAVQPAARLIHTEDLGKTHSTPRLAYQAQFENERRWLSSDLLTGTLSPGRLMWRHLVGAGVLETELHWFQENACPPDILGLNYYLTSERFLDHRIDHYPVALLGGNGRHRYADVEAVRAMPEGIDGLDTLMREASARFNLPMAVTEVHLGCSREEQLRWLNEAWQSVKRLRADKIDVRAITAWALLGSFDWDSLVTQRRGHYESGAFDVRAVTPRATALARMIRQLAAGHAPHHPVLDSPGWWRKPNRLICGPAANCVVPPHRAPPAEFTEARDARPVLITGKRGTLGSAFARICQQRGIACCVVARDELDITDVLSVERAFARWRPWAVINAAGYVRVDQAEREPEQCHQENVVGPAILAKACSACGIQLLTFSSDLVFDGTKVLPYIEQDQVAPLNVYGRTKALAEQRVFDILPPALIVRTSAFFGPWDEHNFVTQSLRRMALGHRLDAVDDLTVTATYVPDLVNVCLDLLVDGESGLWHLSNAGSLTWAQLAQRAADVAGQDGGLVQRRRAVDMGYLAPRPAFSALGSQRASLMPGLDDALARYIKQCPLGRWNGSSGCVDAGVTTNLSPVALP